MIKELFIIWNPNGEHTTYCDTYEEFIIELCKLNPMEIIVSGLEVLTYDEEYIDVDIGYDGELFISDHETGEDLRELVYKGKYNFNKARLLKLDNDYYKYTFKS